MYLPICKYQILFQEKKDSIAKCLSSMSIILMFDYVYSLKDSKCKLSHYPRALVRRRSHIELRPFTVSTKTHKKEHCKWKSAKFKVPNEARVSNKCQSFHPQMHISFKCISGSCTRRDRERESEISKTWINNWKTNMTYFRKYHST